MTTPLLDGELHRDATAGVDAIASALVRPYDEWPLSRADDPTALRSASLASGRAGVALFYGVLGQARGDDDSRQLAVRFLNESIELLSERAMDSSLFCGFTGIAWVTHQLATLWGSDASELNEELDEHLTAHLETTHGPASFDLVNGLVGIGLYALERSNHPMARRALARVLDLLHERAQSLPPGRAWSSDHVEPGADPTPHFYNVGLSHGTPGVAGFLGRVIQRGLASDRDRALLDDAVTWTLAQRLAPDSPSLFPDHVGPGRGETPARTGWCYGDPGVAAGLLAAARSTGNAEWEQVALDAAHRAARRAFEDTGVVDAGLCHGAAGVAHIFHRLYRATHDEICADAARSWFQRALSRRRKEDDVAGFSAWSFERVREGAYTADPCWLTGAAGIGLALLSATGASDFAWDRALLVDVG